jgi:mycofactocin precursor
MNEGGNGVVGGGAGRMGDGAPRVLAWGTAQSWQSGSGDRLGLCPEEVRMLAQDQDTTQEVEERSDEDVVDELLVEEVSIDGMCGVY